MVLYQEGDIVCTTAAEAGGHRGRVVVNGMKLAPPQATPYIYLSAKLYATADEAMKDAIAHVKANFPPGGPAFEVKT